MNLVECCCTSDRSRQWQRLVSYGRVYILGTLLDPYRQFNKPPSLISLSPDRRQSQTFRPLCISWQCFDQV